MMDRKKVVVVGANGNLAKELIPLLIKNYEVHSLIRSAPSFGINSIFLRFVEGDALSPDTWDECLEGKDAVISCFGVRTGEDESRHLQFTNLLIQKMAQKGVKRLISFFSHGAIQPQEGKPVFENQGFPNKERGACHSQCIAALQGSELDYTAVCLWKFQPGASQVAAEEQTWSQCPADSEGVAVWIQGQIEQPHFSRKTVFLHNQH